MIKATLAREAEMLWFRFQCISTIDRSVISERDQYVHRSHTGTFYTSRLKKSISKF